jgi:cytoskeletal protein RodZ
MTPNNNISFGRYLKSVRLSKGISIQEISAESRISSDTLINIENEDHNKLPSEVYVKGFLRAFANYVEADGDRVIDTYVQNLHSFQEINNIKLEVPPSGESHWGKLFLSLCVLFVL